MRERRVSWYPTDAPAAVARAAGARILVVPQSPGATKGTDTYIGHLDVLVKRRRGLGADGVRASRASVARRLDPKLEHLWQTA